jgi:hypothetical protein
MQVNIENDSSAFIEIHVAKGKWDSDDDFGILLPVVSFMSPSESKNKVNSQRVKIFTDQTNLAKDTANQEWEFVKIVCTQPFNKVTLNFK